MRLSKNILQKIKPNAALKLPGSHVFNLPEKVLQFGTGVFVRGLIDYFIDKANNDGLFNGRVVMVKSTDVGSTDGFTEQDCLYTLLMKSVDGGIERDEKMVCAGVSRVLDAKLEWQKVLDCATDPNIKIIVSNTTEVGIVLQDTDRVTYSPPLSFPGKLLAFLFHRYKAFNGAPDSGLVIIPTELITNNGAKLKTIVTELARLNELGPGFLDWLDSSNDFCNSLVDRIVPGRLPAPAQKEMETALGYEDSLMIMAETFGLWAIESDSPRVAELLTFSKTHPGIHIVKDIEKFRELKLRLLNASHNLSCALGFVAGFETVKEAMANTQFDLYMQHLILGDIAAAIISEKIAPEDAREFGSAVLDRYRNPYIEFEWLSICVQDTSKIKIRAVPVAQQHYAKYGFVPDSISMGFAAYILFMRSEKNAAGQYIGSHGGKKYMITDDFAASLHEKWKKYTGLALVKSVLGDETLWETNLCPLGKFGEAVTFYLESLDKSGFFETVKLPFHKTNAAV